MKKYSLLVGVLMSVTNAHAAATAQWAYSQRVQVEHAGPVRMVLPMDTLSKATPELSDVRLVDVLRTEIAYFVDQPKVQPERSLPLENMRVEMQKGKTVITGRVPLALRSRVSRIVLMSASQDFLKPATLEGSRDGQTWKTLVRGVPLFKELGERESNSVDFPTEPLEALRLTLDDIATPPIRIFGISVFADEQPLTNLQIVPLQVAATASDSRETTLSFFLPAQHLALDHLDLVVTDRAFRRPVTVLAKVFANGQFQDEVLGHEVIYRLETSSHVSISLRKQVPGSEIVLKIANGDSRPLTVEGASAAGIPTAIVFDAPTAGTYELWVGNAAAPVKAYDVAALQTQFARVAQRTATVGPLNPNAAYHASEPLPQLASEGTDIDLGPWHARKPVTLIASGVQRLELDPEVLAHNGARLAALRLVRQGRQLPYVVDPSGVARRLEPTITELPTKGPVSRWQLKLPVAGLPLRDLQVTVPDALFQRTVTLSEEIPVERGELVRHTLGIAQWTRTVADDKTQFAISINSLLQTDTMALEIDNGDNPPIHLQRPMASYQAPRIVFKAAAGPGLFLYYNQPDAPAPVYDVQLIATQLLNELPNEATLGAEQILKVSPWWRAPVPSGHVKWLFWAVLVLVVATLLFVMVRLLPNDKDLNQNTQP